MSLFGEASPALAQPGAELPDLAALPMSTKLNATLALLETTMRCGPCFVLTRAREQQG